MKAVFDSGDQGVGRLGIAPDWFLQSSFGVLLQILHQRLEKASGGEADAENRQSVTT
jgi:hypothetical protein